MAGNLSEDEEFELLSLEREKHTGMAPPSFQDQIPGILKQAGQAAMASSPAKLTQKFMQTDPATMQRVGGPALPIVGGMAGGPIGAAAGEFARQVTGTAFAPDTVPATGLGRAASVMTAGVLQEPKMLNAIPGVPQVSEMMGNLASKAGKGLARASETLSGVPRNVITQAAEQGVSSYGAPSLPKASEVFGEALGPKGRAAMKIPAGEAFDPALGRARDLASEIGAKLEKGDSLSALDALKARQATDRIISATPITDKLTRKSLFDWRSKFDDALASQSDKLKDASTLYRQALVKDKILNLTRMNKSGEPSAFLPMLVGHGMMGRGIEGGLGMLTGTSPLMHGLAATVGGDTFRAINSIAQNPQARQVLLQVLQKLTQNQPQPQGVP